MRLNMGKARFARDNVTVNTAPSPLGFSVLGTSGFRISSSVCSDNSRGPAVSANSAVMGMASRGPQPCEDNGSVMGRPDKFVEVIDKAIECANASYLNEDSVEHGPGASVGT